MELLWAGGVCEQRAGKGAFLEVLETFLEVLEMRGLVLFAFHLNHLKIRFVFPARLLWSLLFECQTACITFRWITFAFSQWPAWWMVQSYFVWILLLLLVCLCLEFFFAQQLSSCLKAFLSSSCEQCQQKGTECEGYINFTMFASNVPKLWWYFEGYTNFNCSQECTDCDAVLCQDAQATLLHWPWPTGGCESNILPQWTVTNTIQQSDPLRCAVGKMVREGKCHVLHHFWLFSVSRCGDCFWKMCEQQI